MLDSIDIIHIRNVCTAHKLLLVPLIDNRALRAAGQDEVRLASNLQKFSICVTIPRMQGLVGIEAVTVPAVQRGRAGLGTVRHDEIPVSLHSEDLNVIGLANTGALDDLGVQELSCSFLSLVDVGSSKELSYHHKKFTFNHQRFADHSGRT